MEKNGEEKKVVNRPHRDTIRKTINMSETRNFWKELDKKSQTLPTNNTNNNNRKKITTKKDSSPEFLNPRIASINQTTNKRRPSSLMAVDNNIINSTPTTIPNSLTSSSSPTTGKKSRRSSEIEQNLENRETFLKNLDLEKEKYDMEEKERIQKEKLEKKKFMQERLKKEEKERIENEKIENERIEKEKIEKERLEKEKIEKEKIEKERVENERIEKERVEREKIEKEKIEIPLETKKVEILDQSDEDIFDIQEYFGKISGQVALGFLDSQKKGTYMLRWSERQHGYMVSYRSNDTEVCHIGPLQKKSIWFFN